MAGRGSRIAFLVLLLALGWSAACLACKRLHDLGMSAMAVPVFLLIYGAGLVVALVVANHGNPVIWYRVFAQACLFSVPMAGAFLALAIIPGGARAHVIGEG